MAKEHLQTAPLPSLSNTFSTLHSHFGNNNCTFFVEEKHRKTATWLFINDYWT